MTETIQVKMTSDSWYESSQKKKESFQAQD